MLNTGMNKNHCKYSKQTFSVPWVNSKCTIIYVKILTNNKTKYYGNYKQKGE